MRVLLKTILVRFCYLTEASTAVTTINSDQEVGKNDARKAEAATEYFDLISVQRGSVAGYGYGNGSAFTFFLGW